MRIIAVIILIFGLALSGGAVYFASEQFAQLEAALRQQAASIQPTSETIETKNVVVASKRLSHGQLVTQEHVKLVAFPVDAAPPTAFESVEEVVGDGEDFRMVMRSIEENEPILRTRVTDFGERATVAAGLAPGMRAVTLPIDSVSGVAGFLLPDDRVDVFLTRGTDQGMSTELILQNVKVIAVDQFSESEATKARIARTVTFEVTLDDAQRLALAQRLGSISLSLRQLNEEEMVEDTGPVTIDDVVTIEEKQVAPERPKLCVRKGTELIC